MANSSLINTRFLSLCFISFLAICNVAVFFNLHTYLQGLGFHGKQAGFLIGLYSLTAMFLYAIATQKIRIEKAISHMMIGMIIMAACGVGYMYFESFVGLIIIRACSGVGMFMLMASCMALLVNAIPPEKSGQAFSLYSVALLAPYSIMPAVTEMALPFVSSPTTIYMASACLLIPSALLLVSLRNDHTKSKKGHTQERALSGAESRSQLLRKPVLTILMTNSIYFTLFSGMFYLFEGLATQRSIDNPGFFFTVQMGVMVLIRLVGGSIFDTFSKISLVCFSMVVTTLGFIMLMLLTDPQWMIPTAVVFGLGMGFCVPPLNSLMFLVSDDSLRGYNANMMMLTIHFGTFAGPFIGAWIIEIGGYDLFLGTAIATTTACTVLFLILNPEKAIRQNQ